jgi:hypothetical protein
MRACKFRNLPRRETIAVLLAAKALVERDLRLGLVKEEELRFVITALLFGDADVAQRGRVRGRAL